MTCNLHINKFLKRQSFKCDSAQFVVILIIDLCMFYCPSIPRDPVESHREKSFLNISNDRNSKNDYSFKEKFGRTTTQTMLIK